jgi:xanthine dehydrogenase accessory factor
MTELSQIRRAAREAQQEQLWLATVMRVKGSAYRRPGARLLFSNTRALAGSVSGGCLEARIVRKGPWLAKDRPSCMRFEGGREEDDDDSPRGSGCDGIVDILIERARLELPCAPLVVIEECLRDEQRAVLATVFASRDPLAPVGGRLSVDEAGKFSSHALSGPTWATLAQAAERALAEELRGPRIVSAAGCEALLEIIEPPPHLFIVGAGPDALPVVELAAALGWGVTVCDTSARVIVRERFAARAELHVGSVAALAGKVAARRTPVAVVMSHDYQTDQQALALFLDSRAAYIGMLGPRRRTERMLSELFPDEPALQQRRLSRVHAPLGLDLGAETPGQIALSAVAEIQAVLTRASALPLSVRRGHPIHPPLPEHTTAAASDWAQTGTG